MSHIELSEVGVKLPIYIVRKDSEAWKALKRVHRNFRPGEIIPVTNEEFDSLKEDVIRIRAK